MSRAIVIDPQRLHRDIAEVLRVGRLAFQKCHEIVAKGLNASREYLKYDDLPSPSYLELSGVSVDGPSFTDIAFLDHPDGIDFHLTRRESARESNAPVPDSYLPVDHSRKPLMLPEPTSVDPDGLLLFLKQNGQKIAEVKALPSGFVRITVDDLIAAAKIREPEYVRVGGKP